MPLVGEVRPVLVRNGDADVPPAAHGEEPGRAGRDRGFADGVLELRAGQAGPRVAPLPDGVPHDQELPAAGVDAHV